MPLAPCCAQARIQADHRLARFAGEEEDSEGDQDPRPQLPPRARLPPRRAARAPPPAPRPPMQFGGSPNCQVSRPSDTPAPSTNSTPPPATGTAYEVGT
jgi:hypothetical protein